MSDCWISYPELSDVVGEDVAQAMCAAYGGVPVYVPTAPKPETVLGRIAGAPALRALCGVYGGMRITVPNGRKSEPRKPEVMALLDEGLSCREIALRLGLTERYVRHVARLARAPRQASLFDVA